jgi:hypothetical protein
LADGVTPETKVDFLKRDLISYVKNVVAQQESITAANIASNAAQLDVETNITIS